MIAARWKTLALVALAALACVGALRFGGIARGFAVPSDASTSASASITAPLPSATRDEPLGRLTVPDVVLTDQHGKAVHLYRDLIAGKTVAMSFVFTRCTTVCPPLGLGFSRLQKQLGDRLGKQVSLISISIDPVNDTPARLLEWGARYGAGPGWTLLTGAKEDIDKVLRALTVYTAAKEEHAPIVLLGNEPAGEWVRAYGLSSTTGLLDTIDRLTTIPALPSDQPGDDSGAKTYFGDAVLLDQDGKERRFYTDLIKGKVVVINVFFATCKSSCPTVSATLGRLQDRLGDKLGKDVHLLSISVDPEVDTPVKLAEYARRFKARPGWYFLTGKKENVAAALRKLGQYVKDPEDHSPVVIVGNEPTGLWKKVLGIAEPDEVIRAIQSVVDDRGAPPR